jgi:CRISPR-associated protein Cmr1
MKRLELKLKTLTPIWTGNVDKNSDILMETGILGSLRWWYEGIIRGLGGRACDPTSEEAKERCNFNAESYENALKQGKSHRDAFVEGLKDVCPACLLFGCTGWRRRFRIEAMGLKTLPLFFLPMKMFI